MSCCRRIFCCKSNKPCDDDLPSLNGHATINCNGDTLPMPVKITAGTDTTKKEAPKNEPGIVVPDAQIIFGPPSTTNKVEKASSQAGSAEQPETKNSTDTKSSNEESKDSESQTPRHSEPESKTSLIVEPEKIELVSVMSLVVDPEPGPKASLTVGIDSTPKTSLSVPITKREGVLGPTTMELQQTPRNSLSSLSVPKKKEGVSGESYDKNLGKAKDIKLPEYDKDEESRSLIKKAIKANDFLSSGLDSNQMIEYVVKAMYMKELPADSCIIKEGENGSHLYVSAEGELKVYKGEDLVNTLGPGHVFGELAILYNSKRNATVKATKPCKLWVLDRKVFHQIMMKSGLQRLDENINFLRSVPLLSKLNRSVLIKMSDLLRVKFYPSGTEIIKQGDEGSLFYIISGGTVSVTITDKSGVTKTVGKLERGTYFGEKALLNDDKRLATCTAEPPGVECLTLDRIAFKEYLGELEELWKIVPAPSPRPSQEQFTSEYEHVQFSDLDVIGTIGVGGFGRVELVACRKDPNKTFALKRLKKVHVVEHHQQVHAFNEKTLMSQCRSDFVCRMYKTYKDRKYLYFLMEACLGGDVWTALQKHRLFEEEKARFMVACVVEAFDYLHSRGIAYRDLKPENLLLDARGYVKVVDFGFAKKLANSGKTWTFAGTPEYVAPEIILNRGHDRAVDYWALGIFVHELLVGRPPFRGSDHMRTYNIILRGIDHVKFPSHVSKMSQLLIKKLCRPSPSERLGYQKDGIDDIRTHGWFKNFNWESLADGTMKAPLIPKIRNSRDMSNFEKYPRDKDIPPDDISGWDEDF